MIRSDADDAVRAWHDDGGSWSVPYAMGLQRRVRSLRHGAAAAQVTEREAAGDRTRVGLQLLLWVLIFIAFGLAVFSPKTTSQHARLTDETVEHHGGILFDRTGADGGGDRALSETIGHINVHSSDDRHVQQPALESVRQFGAGDKADKNINIGDTGARSKVSIAVDNAFGEGDAASSHSARASLPFYSCSSILGHVRDVVLQACKDPSQACELHAGCVSLPAVPVQERRQRPCQLEHTPALGAYTSPSPLTRASRSVSSP
eukprot:6193414-Pleurochrysis_carterae.AAC.1